jgi:hypothetical protein
MAAEKPFSSVARSAAVGKTCGFSAVCNLIWLLKNPSRAWREAPRSGKHAVFQQSAI